MYDNLIYCTYIFIIIVNIIYIRQRVHADKSKASRFKLITSITVSEQWYTFSTLKLLRYYHLLYILVEV